MSFELDLRAFIEKAKGNAGSCGPVGSFTADLWAVNSIAKQYNEEVFRYNAELRKNPENLTKAGRLRPGLKVNDSMDIKAPEGYVGGRFRGNWQVTFGVPASGETGRIDPNGGDTLAAGIAVIAAYNSSINSIWITNNVPYAIPLEYGHSSQAPRGVVRVTMADAPQDINRAVQELDR
ncbi:hypothetical protein ACFSHR_01355 [Azotobacter chroococcum]